ncbi:hypothetical protein JZ751_000346 [Albula glossodonta]|uniref:Uncharacterized protein n=1 Tax=Albula glossodonta TaxID=121402 RepID=A0A8T2PW47_9TELE|nr:hypothetical protein JZ751_000346 [Albula glossodonta]
MHYEITPAPLRPVADVNNLIKRKMQRWEGTAKKRDKPLGRAAARKLRCFVYRWSLIRQESHLKSPLRVNSTLGDLESDPRHGAAAKDTSSTHSKLLPSPLLVHPGEMPSLAINAQVN